MRSYISSMFTHGYEDSTRPVEVVDPALREQRYEMFDGSIKK